MKWAIVLAILALFALPAFAATDCNTPYEACIQACCDQCGSTTARNSGGDLVCNAGTENNPNNGCINACAPCSPAYYQCMQVPGNYDSKKAGATPPSSGCCSGALILLAVAGFAFAKQ